MWVTIREDTKLRQTPGQVQAVLRIGNEHVPSVTEYPLPHADGWVAACVSWRAQDEPTGKADLTLTFAPGRAEPIEGITPVNLWPDPYVDRPVNCGGPAKHEEWYFGGHGKARQYEHRGVAAERTPGAGKSIRIETGKPGNWKLQLRQYHNLVVTPGEAYRFSLRYVSDSDYPGYLQIGYANSETRKAVGQTTVSKKPRMYWATKQWRMRSLTFVPPANADRAHAYVSLAVAGVLWLDDFAAVPVYEPLIQVKALDEEYGMTDRHARFAVQILHDRDGLIRVVEGAVPSGFDAWVITRLPSGVPLEAYARVGESGPERPVQLSQKGLVEVPLPQAAGRHVVRLRFARGNQGTVAQVERHILVRGNVQDPLREVR